MSDGVKPRYKLLERLCWLIRLRWIAVTGVFLTVLCVTNIFRIPLEVFPIYIIACLLVLCNAAYTIFLKRIRRNATGDLFRVTNRFANAQIFLDLVFLTGLIHFSGGIENPFIFYFIFHMIIASILLSRRASFLQATFATFIFCFIVALEYLGALHHYPLEGFVPVTLHNNLLYVSGELFVFISTLYIAVYMATSISARLRRREESLEEANILLNEKDRIKSEYVLRVTHDIKEHLSAIESCVEPVAKGITGRLNDGQRNLLSRAHGRTEKLLSFVRALLEVTRIKLARRIKLEEYLFLDSIRAVSEDIKSMAIAKGINFKMDIDASIKTIKGVRVYIEEAVSNLLANSIKYTLGGGEVFLKVKDKRDTILVLVKDTGIGIPKDELRYIFDEFYRARNAKDLEKTGTGLGLSITKEIVEMHKGKIWVDSEETKGTTFYIELLK